MEGNTALDYFIVAVVLSIFSAFLYIVFYAIRNLRADRRAVCHGWHTRTCSDLSHCENGLEDIGLLFDSKTLTNKQD